MHKRKYFQFSEICKRKYGLKRLLQNLELSALSWQVAAELYADESASYRAAKDIEDRITAREAEGCTPGSN
jgi:hypothetical protein